MTPGHFVCGVSYFDFIYTVLEVNQMPKKGAFGYDMKNTKMNDWSRKDSSSHSDLRGHIHLFQLILTEVLGEGNFSCQYRSCGINMDRV